MLEVVAMQPSKMWMQDEGFAIAQDMLQRHPDITVFFGRSDALALGAAHAVKVANVGTKVWVFGFAGDVAGLKAVKDGVLDATMTQSQRLQCAARSFVGGTEERCLRGMVGGSCPYHGGSFILRTPTGTL